MINNGIQTLGKLGAKISSLSSQVPGLGTCMCLFYFNERKLVVPVKCLTVDNRFWQSVVSDLEFNGSSFLVCFRNT